MAEENQNTKTNKEFDLDQVDLIIDLKNEATSLYKRKQYIEALGRLEEAIKILPGDLELLFFEAQCLYQLGDINRAENILSQIYKLEDSHGIKHLPKMLGLCLLRLEKFKEAEKFLRDTINNVKNDIQLKGMLGYALERQNLLDEAKEVFESILKEEPDNPNACNSLAYIYYKLNRSLDKAIALVKKALSREPENPAYLDTMGMLLMKKGNTAQARKTLKKAIKIDPKNTEIMAHLGELLKI
ncbi:MAG: tetratricopeptide repeat protein [Spirochaetia bacterium]|nr:tetratricopeptide repeat protein [Spirochaetia bacterium]